MGNQLAPETKSTLTEQALHAAEQNMTDVIGLWHNQVSNMTLGVAIRDMKNDGLKLVKAARKAGQTEEERSFKADLLSRIAALESELKLAYKGAAEFAETAAKYQAAYGPLA